MLRHPAWGLPSVHLALTHLIHPAWMNQRKAKGRAFERALEVTNHLANLSTQMPTDQ